MDVVNELKGSGLSVGLVMAEGVRVGPSSADQRAEIHQALTSVLAGGGPGPAIKGQVRDLLRRGGYKPSGRGKPASEYLAQAAGDGTFPFINNLVEVNNLISLISGLPASLLDGDVLGRRLRLRLGAAGESYVFNSSGQSIDLEGLIVLCGDRSDGLSVPLGNPVKDSMAAKLTEGTTTVIGCVYLPTELAPDDGGVAGLLERFADGLKRWGGAAKVSVQTA